ncbi:MAG TPA: hypothetical protein VFZ18_14100 [Longimicrobiaceae bacterium]
MHTTASDGQRFLLQRIEQHLRSAEAAYQRLRRANLSLLTASLAATGLATVVAGLTAATGPLAGQGPPAWRWTCGAIAVVTALSGVFTGLLQHLRLPERSAQALSCAARLRALHVALGLSRRDADEVAREYEEVVAQFPEFAG